MTSTEHARFARKATIMHRVGGQGTTSGVRLWPSPSTQSAAGDDASPVESSAVQKGSGPSTPRNQTARSPLSPAAEFYAKALGWPVMIAGDGVAVECGRSLDVIEIPARYGPRVRQLLHEKSMHAPIIATLAGDQLEPITWAFICQVKPPHGQHVVVTQLAMHGVVHTGGGTFPLPPSATCNGRWLQWIYPAPSQTPTRPLPPWAVVAACALTATRKPKRL
ncbi:hypothetical protein JOF56_000841 [Kibdelosporangium banguiense]|uniref:Uncharacterized protein n=1 Tax=Kibdelosporangium banguiense TaxID=1365924 RepID=A0ABS4T9E0_9PSEU|nr:hypothetical protein [Kibdelosporangium banguiense]